MTYINLVTPKAGAKHCPLYPKQSVSLRTDFTIFILQHLKWTKNHEVKFVHAFIETKFSGKDGGLDKQMSAHG